MLRPWVCVVGAIGFAIVVLFSQAAFAQSGTIAGSVKDASGAVLPGVRVEAASPALIEKVRSNVTDGSGEYKLIDLRPGTYTVTFTLDGFSTVRREGIELTAGITAAVNAELRVGNLEETVTVSGASPLVDVQNTTLHRGIERDTIDALPTGRTWANLAVLIPGTTRSGQDVGGSAGDGTVTMSIHGSMGTDTPKLLEGMRYGNLFANMNQSPTPINNGMVQEVAVDTGGSTSEADVSGVRANIILKQGGNRFTGYFYGDYMNGSMEANNIDAALINRGIPTPTINKKMWDINPAFGGPIRRDSLWFYGSFRYYGLTQQPAGAFYAKDPLAYTYTPDVARGPAVNPSTTTSENLRLTWQATPNNKLGLYGDQSNRCNPCASATAALAYEATTQARTPFVGDFQGTWEWVRSNRLLFEAGETYKPEHLSYPNQPSVPDSLVGIVDTGLGLTYRAPVTITDLDEKSRTDNGRASVSYVTGSHNLKIGAQWEFGHRVRTFYQSGDMNYTFVNGTPSSLTLRTTPIPSSANLKLNLGVFVQEQWTLKRMTINAGVRFDYVNAYNPEEVLAPTQFVGPRDFPAQYDLPDYKDLNPRIGVSYDPFGKGNTAVKAYVGRFVQGIGTLIADAVNPTFSMTQTLANSATRSWTDSNGNFIPDCNLTNFAAQDNTASGGDKCGPINNTNFGSNTISTNYAPGAAVGWGKRLYNWETSVGVQHQLRPGLSIDGSYNRRWFGNLTVTNNVLVTPNDFTSFCIQAPSNAVLPGGGGEQICGFNNVSSTLFGQNNNLITQASNFGQQTMIYDGVDFSVNARLARGVLLQGGTSTGRLKQDLCGVVVGSPNLTITSPYPAGTLIPADTAFCDVVPPFQTQVKILAVYPLPLWQLQASATLQSLPGPEIQATYAAPASAVVGLGRPLSGGATSVSVPLVPSGTLYGDRLNQLDLRMARKFNVKGVHILAQADLYNLMNANPVLTLNNAFGTNWQKPVTILPGRLLKLGAQVTF